LFTTLEDDLPKQRISQQINRTSQKLLMLVTTHKSKTRHIILQNEDPSYFGYFMLFSWFRLGEGCSINWIETTRPTWLCAEVCGTADCHGIASAWRQAAAALHADMPRARSQEEQAKGWSNQLLSRHRPNAHSLSYDICTIQKKNVRSVVVSSSHSVQCKRIQEKLVGKVFDFSRHLLSPTIKHHFHAFFSKLSF